MLNSLGGVLYFFFSLNNNQCQKVSVLIWYRKLQNTPSREEKKNQSENARKPASGPVAAPGCCQNPPSPPGPGENCELRGGVTSAAGFLIAFSREGESLRAVAGRKAQSQARPTALRGPAGLRSGFFLFCFGFGFFCRGFVFSERILYSPVEQGAACSREGALRVRAAAAGRGGCAAGRSAEAQVGAPRGSAFGGTDGPARPAAGGEAAATEVCINLRRPCVKCPL